MSAELSTALTAEISVLDQRISEAEKDATHYDKGLILDLIRARVETLKLTRTMLENRVAAETGKAVVEITIPAAAPDAERAAQILADIETQRAVIAEAEAEARTAKGGLTAAIAHSRVQSEKLILAHSPV